MRQVCQAMQFVHQNQIIHLDLKPENILCLTREGNRIKIIDFGLARRYDPDKKLQVYLIIGVLLLSSCCQNFMRISFPKYKCLLRIWFARVVVGQKYLSGTRE